jgi:hypothetical protein
MLGRRQLGLVLVAGVLSCVLAAPVMAHEGGPVAAAAKKCKKKRHHKKCRKRAPGDQAAPYVPPALTVSPTSHNYGSRLHNTASPAFTFVITNTGGFSMQIEFHMVGTNANQFAFVPSSNTCIGQIPIGASCQVGVQFAPTSVGAKSATLNAVGLYDVTASSALSGSGT